MLTKPSTDKLPERSALADEGESALDAFHHRLRRLLRLKRGPDHIQPRDHRQKRQPVQEKTYARAERGHRDAGDQRTHHSRQVELNRIQRYRVGNVFALHQSRNQRLVGRSAERHGRARHEHQDHHVPDLHHLEIHQQRQDEGAGHLDVLRSQQNPAAIDAVGDHAADERKQHDRQISEESEQTQEERGSRTGHFQHQPGLSHALHPRSGGRRERARPHQAEVAVAECLEGALEEFGPAGSLRRRFRCRLRGRCFFHFHYPVPRINDSCASAIASERGYHLQHDSKNEIPESGRCNREKNSDADHQVRQSRIQLIFSGENRRGDHGRHRGLKNACLSDDSFELKCQSRAQHKTRRDQQLVSESERERRQLASPFRKSNLQPDREERKRHKRGRELCQQGIERRQSQ